MTDIFRYAAHRAREEREAAVLKAEKSKSPQELAEKARREIRMLRGSPPKLEGSLGSYRRAKARWEAEIAENERALSRALDKISAAAMPKREVQELTAEALGLTESYRAMRQRKLSKRGYALAKFVMQEQEEK